ncbi:MAG: Uncharacterised protein [Flavobacteriaceae bacterium]|jgi:hypothetical protein|nr:hypothetical protein [Flavobacteriaceae bacterium]CAI8184201.1 MAG: Uncharacterised protein [Flavobacteriaceae bacterium]
MSNSQQILCKILFKGDHLIFTPEQVDQFFGRVSHVYVATDLDHKRVNICAVAQVWFTKVHKGAAQMMLKQKNLEGAKSLNIKPFLIDLEIDSKVTDDLEISFSDKTGLIQIDF